MSEDVDRCRWAGEYPDVPRAVLQLDLCFVDVQHWPGHQLREQYVVGLAILVDEQMPEIREFPEVHTNAEGLIEQRGQRPDPEPMGNVP
jgi:hypothetical protein